MCFIVLTTLILNLCSTTFYRHPFSVKCQRTDWAIDAYFQLLFPKVPEHTHTHAFLSGLETAMAILNHLDGTDTATDRYRITYIIIYNVHSNM